VISASAVYYTPLVGNILPIYNGSSFTPTVFSEISLSLVSQHTASTIYDVFAFNNGGVVTLATGPAWNTSTAGSGARGTGAGTTQLSRLNGIWVNTVSMTGRNGATTYTIPASQGSYLGSISIDSAAGQVTCHRSYGQSRKFGVWNAYNRVPIIVKGGDGTASWSYSAPSFRPSNNNTANSIQTFTGLAEEMLDLSYFYKWNVGTLTTSQSTGISSAIGFNSTSASSGLVGNTQYSFGAGVVGNYTLIGSVVTAIL
jgi:hypothetical protein